MFTHTHTNGANISLFLMYLIYELGKFPETSSSLIHISAAKKWNVDERPVSDEPVPYGKRFTLGALFLCSILFTWRLENYRLD